MKSASSLAIPGLRLFHFLRPRSSSSPSAAGGESVITFPEGRDRLRIGAHRVFSLKALDVVNLRLRSVLPATLDPERIERGRVRTVREQLRALIATGEAVTVRPDVWVIAAAIAAVDSENAVVEMWSGAVEKIDAEYLDGVLEVAAKNSRVHRHAAAAPLSA